MKRTFSRIIANTLMGLAAMAATVSCTQDELVDGRQNNGCSVKLSLTTEDFTPVNTRAIEASAIKDLAVFQFQNGKLTNQFILEDKAFTGGALNVTEFQSQPVTQLDEEGKVVPGNENIIVFLANMKCNGMLTESTFTNNTTSYTDFLAQSYKFANAEAITNANYIPMYGTWTQGLTDGVTNSLSVTLTRAMAYINFTINTQNFTLPSGEGTLQGSPIVGNVKLHNVPLALTLPSKAVRPALPVNQANGVWSDGSKDGANAYPEYAAADFVEFDEAAELTQTGNSANTTFQFYVNENCRGSFDAIDTYAAKKAQTNNEIAGLTYITFDLTYTTAEGKEAVASYRINLGGNNTGDFNIRGGAQYNVTTNVYGIGNNNERTNIDINYTFNVVDITASKPDSVTLLPDANCYMLQPDNIADNKYDGKTLVLRLTQPRTGWQYVQANEKPETGNYATDFETLVKAGSYKVETLWQTAGASSFSIEGTTASDLMTAGNGVDESMKHYFVKLTKLPKPDGNCSALIVLKATAEQGTIQEGDILWSWHLWFTNYNFDNISDPSTINGQGVATTGNNGEAHRYAGAAFSAGGQYPTGLGMMDRNLGATFDVTSLTYEEKSISKWYAEISSAIVTTEGSDFSKLRGMYYQFGRPTPFPYQYNGSSAATGVYDANGTAFSFKNECIKDLVYLPSTTPLAYGIKNPATYFSNQTIWWSSPNTDWPEIFDPSPAGWCLPQAIDKSEQKNVWYDFQATSGSDYNTTVCNWVGNAKGAVYTGITDTNVYYPASGFVDRTSGAFTYVGSSGYYWSSTTSSATNGRLLYFNATAMNRSRTFTRAGAFPVRSVQK